MFIKNANDVCQEKTTKFFVNSSTASHVEHLQKTISNIDNGDDKSTRPVIPYFAKNRPCLKGNANRMENEIKFFISYPEVPLTLYRGNNNF